MPTSSTRHYTARVPAPDYAYLAGTWQRALAGAQQTHSLASVNGIPGGWGSGWASATWGSANLAVYYPVVVSAPITVTTAWVANGSGAGTDSFDIGIYNESLTKLGSTGGTASSGANQQQTAALTASVSLLPGRYYLAMARNGSTANEMFAWVTPGVRNVRYLGIGQESSAYTLPATATPVAYSSSARFYAFGIF